MPTDDSFSAIWTPPVFTTVTTTTGTDAAGETVVNDDVYDSDTGTTIDTKIASNPYNFLLGTTAADGSNTEVDEGAAAVEPITDGEPDSTGSTATPTDLGAYVSDDPADLDPAVFEAWTSEQQSEYLNYWIAQDQNGDTSIADYNSTNGTDYTSWAQVVAVIGTNSGSTTAPITAVLSASVPGTVYIINNLQATDFASMSLADQEAIAGTAYFQNTLAPELDLQVNSNLVTIDSTASSTLASEAISSIDAAMSQIYGTETTTVVNADGSVTTTTTTMNADGSTTTSSTTSATGSSTEAAGTTTSSNTMSITTPTGPVTVTDMPAADVAVFISELQLLATQLGNQAIISDSQIATDVQAITGRFTVAAAFWTQDTPTTSAVTGSKGATTDLTSGVVSEDNNASIAQTYTTLIQQEQQILASEQASANVATTGLIGGVQPDAPTLLAYFEIGAYTVQGSLITIGTAELQAINVELQEYSDMQNLVNTTLEKFGSNSNSSSTASLAGAATSSDLTAAQLTVAEMFDSTTGTTPSPLDLLFGIQRPTTNLLGATGTTPGSSLPTMTQTQWNDFNTQLSNAVTQLQQQSQILTDQVNQDTQVQDNEFTLGNTALSQMSDMIDEIGRNLAQ